MSLSKEELNFSWERKKTGDVGIQA